ncbi:MAG: hypothetical protein DRR19_32395 [Candidatus Parabeggiatoa sp. nov. 1]|nr:MAG: hypothetical protein DRR19_32395 [Gammaproteobacteria bacterium]
MSINFSVNKIIYNDGRFSIAWGQWKEQTMSVAISELSNWEKWDRQIEKDAESGNLDFLIEEALSEKKQGILKDI